MFFDCIRTSRRKRLELLFLGVLLPAPTISLAQRPTSLRVQPVRMDSVTDSAGAALPASHRTVATKVDQPVKVKHCPSPAFPRIPWVYGYPFRVAFVFVVDTMGLPEMDDIIVKEATDQAFVPAARRAISKCRYEPARLKGHPVRLRVEQAVTYGIDNEWRGEVTRWREDRAR